MKRIDDMFIDDDPVCGALVFVVALLVLALTRFLAKIEDGAQ